MTDTNLGETPSVQDMIAAFPLPTLVIGQEEKVERLNAAAEILLGKGLVGRHFTTALRQPSLVDAVERSLRDRAARSVSYQLVENGSDAYYDAHLQTVAGTGLLLLSFENTKEIEQAEQMRRDFVANVSHELRTPLTAVMGFIETLQGPARDDAKVRDRFLSVMAGETERMNRLVRGLLSLSEVEADERVRPTEKIDLRDILQTTLSNLAPLAQNNNVALREDTSDAVLQVTGDTDQLQQVFTNLVENAIKYGGADQSVEISTLVSAHDPVLRGPAIEITVADHGPGIDAIHLPRLTERFYRADNHRSRELGGTGLGLAIVKHILNRHRGRLKISSQMGQGSRFTVVLPCESPSA